jgi:hypothetical protein
MQNPKIQTGEQTERNDKVGILSRKGIFITPFLALFLIFCGLYFPENTYGAEKQSKRPVAPKEIVVVLNDSNVQGYLDRADDLLRKGSFDTALKIYLKIDEFSEEVLQTLRLVKANYEKVLHEPSLKQNDKEQVVIKLRSIDRLTVKYSGFKETSVYVIGYISAKKGDTERARKYLLEVLQTAPFSTDHDSRWMKAKTLLLSLYNLEGEF